MKRMKLLEENGDCQKCCRDCPINSFRLPRPRMCSEEKEGTSCGKNNKLHELCCRDAKLCFLATAAASAPDDISLMEWRSIGHGTLLPVMRLPCLLLHKEEKNYETMLWDTASTHNYVRKGHTEEMGFPSRSKEIRICTIGSEVKAIDGVIYKC